MGNAGYNIVKKKGKDQLPEITYKSLNDIPVRPLLSTGTWTETKIGGWTEGKKAILCVNLASKWGLTDKNYK